MKKIKKLKVNSYCLIIFVIFFLIELAIKVALDEFMEKIKQSGAVFHNNNDSQPSQTSIFSFTDLSTHLFAAFASHDCPSPLFLDQNSSDDDPYSMSTHNYDQPFKSILIGNKQINVPPGKSSNFRLFFFSLQKNLFYV
jgi:hypothetical protein